MKRILFILAVALQCAFVSAAHSTVADSLLNELRALPHDSTRLKLLEKLVLTEQNSPHYIEYAKEMFEEAQFQKTTNTEPVVLITNYCIIITRMKLTASANW